MLDFSSIGRILALKIGDNLEWYDMGRSVESSMKIITIILAGEIKP